MIRTAYELAREGLKLVRGKDRTRKARNLLYQLRWMEDAELPVEYLGNLFPGIIGVKTPVSADISHRFELPYGERSILSSLVDLINPDQIFEFGTFTGATTKLLADSAPQARVHTLDLPNDELISDAWIKEVIGIAFRDNPDYNGRITQIRSNSHNFDYTPFHNKCDLVFVDASHEYEDVVHDSNRAFEIVSPRGIIVWDDYQATAPGVVKALNQVNREGMDLVRIASSRLAVYSVKGFSKEIERNCNGTNWESLPRSQNPVGEIYGIQNQ